jgi:eukaryotic-like serine/threonine-protein kinase
MLAGRTPRTAESLTQFLAHGHDQPIPALRGLARDVPDQLEDVVMRCLARIPGYRPPSAEALAAELAPTSAGLPTVAVGKVETRTRVATAPGGPYGRAGVSRIRLLADRPRAAALTVAVVALALLAGGILAFSNDSESGAPPQAPPEADTSAAEQARDFSEWLRDNSQP